MKENEENDITFKKTYLEYERSGNCESLLVQIELRIRRISSYKYRLDEDGRAEVLLAFLQKLDNFSKLKKERNVENLPAFANTFVGNLIRNQWKKENRFLKKDCLSLNVERFLDPKSEEIHTEESSFSERFWEEVFRNSDPRAALIFKLKHNLYLNRRDLFLLKSILLVSGNSPKSFLEQRKQKRYRIRNRELTLCEKLERSHQLLFGPQKDARLVSSKIKRNWRKKLLKADSIYTYREISFWFGWKDSVIKKLYRQMRKRVKNVWSENESSNTIAEQKEAA
ncbi:sigma-70 family RNA polymerase sigma factor [Leptospira gomenensis]|uniref:sigma-70 family RNA polymerase sigma factor n=1 Tax=Leptospira gomenensis TaxID=2484974 RepID=UPI001AF026A8|nr:sigma-70 family RNA polymerase sigma factor [Leptospira gomenensis]